MANAPWWTLPYQAYTYQGPKAKLPGILGKIHEAIDPSKFWGGYGGVLGAAMMGPGISEWHNNPDFQTVFKNPSVAKIDRLSKAILKSGRSPEMRWVTDTDGNLYVGDAYNFTHQSLNPATDTALPRRAFGLFSREGDALRFEAYKQGAELPATDPTIDALKIPRAGWQQMLVDRLGTAP